MDMYLRRQPWDDLGHVSFDQLLQPVAHRAVELVGASEVEGERLGVVALEGGLLQSGGSRFRSLSLSRLGLTLKGALQLLMNRYG